MNFDNMTQKALRHCFVPADQASLTLVFMDGMRRSFGFGAGNVKSLTQPNDTEGCVFSGQVTLGPAEPNLRSMIFDTDRGPITLTYGVIDPQVVPVELPE